MLNKSGLVRAKASNFNSKSLNKCFSNYYQVRTWPVFAETITFYRRRQHDYFSDNFGNKREIMEQLGMALKYD